MRYLSNKGVILLVIFISVSCAIPTFPYVEPFYSVNDVSDYVSNNIGYRKDLIEFWQYPSETINKGYGDCEDFASLKAELILNNVISNEVLLIACRNKITDEFHMLLQVDGVYIESVHNIIYRNNEMFDINYSVIYKIDIRNYMMIARIMHIFS